MTRKLTSSFLAHILLVVVLALFRNSPLLAYHPISDAINALCETEEATEEKACEIKSRLSPFEPNYVIWQKTDGDENALEVHYSFRYLFTRPHCLKEHDFIYEYSEDDSRECIENYQSRWEAFFAFTGEFDFYVGTRPSGPVVNRISNPGFHYRQHFSDKRYKWLDFSIEHRSNGQVIEIDEMDGGILKTQVAFNSGDHAYFDGISRGANFLKLETKFELSDDANLYVSAKSYINHDSAVNWGPDAINNPSIKDYDRVKFIYSDGWRLKGKEFETSIEWLIGDEGLKTDSFDIDIMFPIELRKLALPLYFRFHKGPMNTLSNYTLDQDTYGFGLKLKPF